MVEFFTFTEASRGPPEASWRSGLWTAVRRLSTPGLRCHFCSYCSKLKSITFGLQCNDNINMYHIT